MKQNESGFTLVETLVAIVILSTLLCFVIPLYITGKQFSQDRMMEDRARLLAQTEVEKYLADLHVEKVAWSSFPYQVFTEVTEEQSLWKVQVIVKWKDIHHHQQHISLNVYRYRNKVSPT